MRGLVRARGKGNGEARGTKKERERKEKEQKKEGVEREGSERNMSLEK